VELTEATAKAVLTCARREASRTGRNCEHTTRLSDITAACVLFRGPCACLQDVRPHVLVVQQRLDARAAAVQRAYLDLDLVDRQRPFHPASAFLKDGKCDASLTVDRNLLRTFGSTPEKAGKSKRRKSDGRNNKEKEIVCCWAALQCSVCRGFVLLRELKGASTKLSKQQAT
jgi:hypothetical protein